jgi:predicted Zn-dependent protease
MLTALLAACTDIISPPRVERYEYRKFVLDGSGEPFPMSFHWPREALPIKVWVAADDPLRPAVLRALPLWENALLYGEVRFALAENASGADIVVRNERVPENLFGTSRLSSRIDGCRGETEFSADIDRGTLTPPFVIWVWTTSGETNPNLPACYDITVLHELGHALGLFAHSTFPNDVMAVDPINNQLTERDRATLEAAYHLPATLRLER